MQSCVWDAHMTVKAKITWVQTLNYNVWYPSMSTLHHKSKDRRKQKSSTDRCLFDPIIKNRPVQLLASQILAGNV